MKDGKNGLRNWVTQFFASKLSEFTEEEKNIIFMDMEKILAPKFWNGDFWTADYRRIQVLAIK